jgi:F-type H+-transporting ATPase subunit b
MRHLTVTEKRKKALRVVTISLAILGTAALAFASEGGGGHADGGAQLKDFMWRVIDFAALAGIIIWALVKQNVKGGLKARQDAIETTLREAAEARDAAERKLKEYTAKLESANKEIDELSATIKTDAAAEKVRIIAEATAMAAKIKEQAEQTVVLEVQKARTVLRQEAARLAVDLAEKKIRENITKSDQDKLVGDYLSKVVELH